jgi:lipopolysaccharide transport system ATP-binding protein
MKPVLEIQNISKKFRIEHLAGGYQSLREKLVKTLKFQRANKEDFWALNDVSFNVEPGESLGIIGRNGAGKSTLLKILSKITPPTRGRIVIRGRMASLLEVGTGFHPELTGRENIFFNGSLLGMRRREIESKFDEIIDFSGTEKFLDTPLKHYSSGMQLRLAFSVAAFLEPEILVIDEVLAVGDAEFQKKCMRKMDDVSRSGRTILFVSHNMAAVQSLCKRSLLIQHGAVVGNGPSHDVIMQYFQSASSTRSIVPNAGKPVFISDLVIDHGSGQVYTGKSVNVDIQVTTLQAINNVLVGVGVNDLMGTRLFTIFSKHTEKKFFFHEGVNTVRCVIDNLPLKPGMYVAEIYVGDGNTVFDYHNGGFTFEVIAPPDIHYAALPDDSQGSIVINQNWN